MTKARIGIFIASLFISICPVGGRDAQLKIQTIDGNGYVSLDELVRSYRVESSFDIITQKGKLFHKSHYAVYTVSFSLFVIDGLLYRSETPVVRRQGGIMIPCRAAAAIIEAFYPDVLARCSGSLVQVDKKPEAKEPAKTGKTPAVIQRGKDRIRFIVIDAGHGGKDPGAVGIGGVHEKEITLSVARRLEKELAARFPSLRIVMTRKKDVFIELSRRTDLANEMIAGNGNGLFISIHVNATLSPIISGYETYYLSQNPSNDDARSTAALENNVVVLEDESKGKKLYDDIDYIEAMMLTTQIQKESMMLAESLQGGLSGRVKSSKSRGVKRADFFVLRGVLMPAALVEIGFITHKKESKILGNASHQNSIASGLARGIADFIRKYNSLPQ